MRILQIIDTPVWAIGHIAASIRKFNSHLEFQTVYVHPKHVSEHIAEVEKWLGWADVVDFQYWNTARQLLELIPELKNKKTLLTHHNEKDLLAADWVDIDLHIAQTRRSVEILEKTYPGKVKFIPHGIDFDFFLYHSTLPNKKTVGYVGRVVPWKGLREVSRACYELGFKLMLMGKFDKPDYWASIPPEHQANIDLSYMECPDEDRANFYHEIDIYVGNSGPGRETGPLGLLEAMASGVPVITTEAGMAKDILEDHENGLHIDFENYEELKDTLAILMGDQVLQERLRANAWNTVKGYTEARRAWEYEKVYHEVFDPVNPLVSVIIPYTPDRLGSVIKILDALVKSDYSHIEAIAVADQSVNEQPRQKSVLVKWLNTDQDKIYGLAMARNMAAIEAQGKYLLFCDSRMLPDPAAITEFVNVAEGQGKKIEKRWWFGNKGTGKKTFVENFSFIRRDQFINAGMFNERIDRYGGMSQEIRARFGSQEFEFMYLDSARASQMTGSHMSGIRRADIVASKLKLWKMNLQ